MKQSENNKTNKKLTPRIPVQEPEYWEVSSYMIGVNAKSGGSVFKGWTEAAENYGLCIDNVTFDKDDEETRIRVDMTYEDEQYKAVFFPIDFRCPDIEAINRQPISDEEMEAFTNADNAVTVFMDYHGDPEKCYLVHLKLISSLLPSLAAVMDESAEKILSPRYVRMMAKSHVLPSPEALYTVQAISSDDGRVWLHTHGLCRCGIHELEILDSDEENFNDHYQLLKVIASRLLDMNEEDENDNALYLGRLSDGSPIVITLRPWNEAIWEYGRLSVGGLSDREESHNTLSDCIFLYTSEEDEENEVLRKVDIYNGLWSDNPMYLISNKETARMRTAAQERFGAVIRYGCKEGCTALIKLGLQTDEQFSEDDAPGREHLWFELKGFEGDRIRAELTQEPYYISDLHEGDTGLYSKDQVSDWRIYTPDDCISPDTCYILM